MLTYNEASALFLKARNKDRGLVLPGRLGQTRLVKTATGYGVKYVNTVVVNIEPNGVYTLDTGGWNTKTTKTRISEYSPVNIIQSKHVWYVCLGNTQVPYIDGMRVTASKVLTKIPRRNK